MTFFAPGNSIEHFLTKLALNKLVSDARAGKL